MAVITPILILHRYLGVVLGLIMTLWCLSGFVMMYQAFPETTAAERAAGLAPIDFGECCVWTGIADDKDLAGATIEMLRGDPVLRSGETTNLRDGATIALLDETAVREVAEAFARGNGVTAAIRSATPITVDQWTPAVWKRQAPMWKVIFANGLFVYINGKTGQVFQDATSRERVLNWFGAIPHWLYPTLLRQNAPVWTQVVIWSAALGTFLTVTGIAVGITKLRGKSGRWFPYRRPMWFLHHVFGIFVGLLVLTWVFSGLLTMQPWGLFESPPTISRADLGGPVAARDFRALLKQAEPEITKGDIVQVRAAALFGEPYLVLRKRDGAEHRVGPALNAQMLAAHLTGAAFEGAKLELLKREDGYYYAHHDEVKLPVWRITLRDRDSTRIYLNSEIGTILRVADGTAQRYRWLESGLHDFDFPILRQRPIWDFVVLPLLLAVTLACATGLWLAISRIIADFRALVQHAKRPKRSA